MKATSVAVSAAAAMALTILPGTALAQMAGLVGWIKDPSGAPLWGATVQIDGQKPIARTDSAGLFRLSEVIPGPARVIIKRIGFEQRTFGIVLTADKVDSVAVTLDASAALLSPVRTEANADRLHTALAGFYRRKATGGSGVFLTRADIEMHHSGRLSDALLNVHGVRLVQTRAGRDLRFTKSDTRGYSCPPQYWVDGRRMPGGFTLDEIPAYDVEAMELYSGPATTPAEFALVTNNKCGSVAIWTRVPGTP